MQEKIYTEGKPSTPQSNVVITKGALQFDPEKKYPVTLAFGDKVVGSAIISREGDDIMADIELAPGLLGKWDGSEFSYSMAASDLEGTAGDVKHVTSCTLRELRALPRMEPK
jgi:hypothetical protein